MPRNREELRLLSKVSKLYYESNLNQGEIAQRLNLSLSKISRLLQQAREEGIVKITVISPPGINSDLEIQLERSFGLVEAIVVDVPETASSESATREVGIAAADYLEKTIRTGDVIGVSWGTSLHRMVEALQPFVTHDVQVVQIIGGLGPPESEVHATDLCRRMAHLLGSQLTLLTAPGIVDNEQVKQAILSDSHVQRVFGAFPRLSVAFVGIGSPAPDSIVMRDSSILTPYELDELRLRGAVGDIALRFFDTYGQPIQGDLDSRVIGITLEQLKRVERVVGVVGGLKKEDAIYGALKGGLINVLITDQITARRLLQKIPVLYQGSLR